MHLSRWMKSTKLSHRFAALLAFFALGYAVYGAWSFRTLDELKVNGPLYQRIAQGKDLIADMLPPRNYIVESYLVTLQMLHATEVAERNNLIESLTKLRKEYDESYRFWIVTVFDQEIRNHLLTQAHLPADAFYAIAFDEFIPAIRSNNEAAASAAMARMGPLYERHRKVIDQIIRSTTHQIASDEALAKERIQSASRLLLAILVVSMGLSIGVAAIILRGLQRPLNRLAGAAERLAQGDFGAVLPPASEDEVGSLVLAFQTMRDKRQGTEKELRSMLHLATHDALTGLPNRQLLKDRVEQALVQVGRSQKRVAVLFIDLDGFKAINDTLGHAVGDQLLREVAQRLVSVVRGEDTVARQGGDEFVVLLHEVSGEQAAQMVAQKMLSALVASCRIDGADLRISASIGLAVSPDGGETVDLLLKNSDVAMYYAKDSGRNNCKLFEPWMSSQLARE